jgi:hypothetical protein
MAVGFERSLQCRPDRGRRSYRKTIANDAIAPLFCEQLDLFRGALAATAPQTNHRQIIMGATHCPGDNARPAPNRGGAID